ncbi:MAG: DNA-binding protein [Candidatus Nitrospira kreftii]|uniref:DNA-binding protein n=1 Tax=Candidatus Nitrospira kreftii TaxID=2652173 RepID=A0A7S8FBC7_9BACT|nr:MAG: DNA-binding protein [Candidatus Nitrospira kreftii]
MNVRILNASGYFDLQALAAYSCCSVRWLRNRLVDHHQPLPHYRVGGKILVKREEFDRWMTTHRTMQPANDLAELVESVVSQIQKPRRTA